MSTFQCVLTYASSATNTSSIKSCMKSSSRVVDPLHVCDPPGPFKLGVNEEDFSSSVGDEMKMLLRRLRSLDGGCSYPAVPSFSSYPRPHSNSTGAQQRTCRRGSLNSMGGYSTSSLSTLDEMAASVDWGPTTVASANNLLMPMRNGTKSIHEDFGNANSGPDVSALRRKMRGMSAELSTGSLRNAMNRNVPMSNTPQKNQNWYATTEKMTASTNAMSLLAALASGNCRNGTQDEKKHTNEGKLNLRMICDVSAIQAKKKSRSLPKRQLDEILKVHQQVAWIPMSNAKMISSREIHPRLNPRWEDSCWLIGVRAEIDISQLIVMICHHVEFQIWLPRGLTQMTIILLWRRKDLL